MTTHVRLPENHPDFGSNKIFDVFNYSPAVKAQGLMFISGQVGIRPDGTIPESATEQARLAFRRLAAILAHEGMDFSNVVELTTYHVDIHAELTDFRSVKDEFLGTVLPAWTIIGVQALARDTLLVEIKATAALPE